MKRFLSQLVPQWVKNLFYHLPLSVIAAVWFRQPGKKLTVIGVTGTNGKTTTVQMIARMLREAGLKMAAASTINFIIGEEERVNITKFTTMSGWQVQKFLREASDAGCTHVVLETSSHALDQYRVWGVPYAIAVMTNVTREHLDYHKTMEEYRRAKRLLFERARMAVVNADMERPQEYLSAREFEKTVAYTTEGKTAGIKAEQLALTLTGSRFVVDGRAYELKLPGRYNVENALAAIGVGTLLGVAPEAMARALSAIERVPGRFDPVPNGRGLHIFVDYAVTPDALEKLCGLAAEMRPAGRKIVAVFGACGERDRGKRPEMGRIVSRVADTIILTNEDPYHEDPERIIDEIEAGITGARRVVKPSRSPWRVTSSS
jgi:UDP-N-acetylmuramoyl-L-alanyl-D-glutamate--2,6-diaminopimelate ligase